MLSPFPVSPLETPYLILPLPTSMRMVPHRLTPATPPWHSSTLGHQAFREQRASPPIVMWQGQPLLHMWLEPWVPPWIHFGWWFSPWKIWGEWGLVGWYYCSSYGLQTPSAPSVFSLTPPLGTQCSVQWLASSTHHCICQALTEPLKKQLYHTPVSMHFLASTIVSGFGDSMWGGFLHGAVSGWPFL